MRTLLVDNYDSFTYNLFHLLTEANGEQPEVIVNDDPRWRLEYLREFDNVVLSPGPGHPGRDADFGLCRDVLRAGTVPTLGVCLGHQGLAIAHGGRVERGIQPCHGRVTPVRHDRTGLFEGIPSPFEVTRYHSLVVTETPPRLAVTAWSDDGVVMGLAHRALPHWGVQFHPESIGSAYGVRLLANFAELTERHAGSGRAPLPGRTVPSRLRPARRRALRVLARQVPAAWPPEAAFTALFGSAEHAYWLDSSRPDADLGRFSIMGDADGPLGRIATADVGRGTVTVRGGESTHATPEPFLPWLDRDLAATRIADPGLPVPFTLGWVGHLGYELKAECGGNVAHRADGPDAVMLFSDRALVLDHHTGMAHLLALAEHDETAPTRWLDHAEQVLSQVPPATIRADRPTAAPPLRLRHDEQRYRELIAECQRLIAAGETYQVCLTNMVEVEADLDPWAGYLFLRASSPAPFGAYLRLGDTHVLSTSPERFIRVGTDSVVESRPIKGTRPRGATPEEDHAYAAELATSVKDRAENLMIVDLVRNDLGRCARPGSVHAVGVFRVETHSMAHQLVSTVQAVLREDCTGVQAVQAAFPPGSMTGAPKRRTMQIIDRLEGGPRGIYSGALGYFSLHGTLDLSVVIRTAVATPGLVRYGSGGAIIALSDPEAEIEETRVKAAPLLSLTGATSLSG
ncbi:aminodeoxychorismate synthase component I [Micromonospora auratinigra]|uniref:aminodeoxychorismate synthase n=1 Tax=Micromonospora auratinigra TaxID=261654 RepID=A0A1A8ZII3_9ACTN|nr:aminodeoxychorismate synthase component I [Micromonospora auratinigra]SBT43651.1 para-aminobenzoate synthetase [Micromonospora auratinigra]